MIHIYKFIYNKLKEARHKANIEGIEKRGSDKTTKKIVE
jgi:hypothetical protein